MRTLFKPYLALVLLASTTACIESVDSTEHCVETRYGEVTNEKVGTGPTFLVLSDLTCFPLTDQNFPSPSGKDDVVEKMEATTKDPITLSGDVTIVYAYDPATVVNLFKAKRSQAAAENEIRNALREGFRSAIAAWTIADIFSERRPQLSDSIKAHIQRKLGDRAIVRNVFLRGIELPQQIERARIAAAEQASILDKAEKQKAVAEAETEALLIRERGKAEAQKLMAQSFAVNPRAADIEIARAMAEGISKACSGQHVNTCIIGDAPLSSILKRP